MHPRIAGFRESLLELPEGFPGKRGLLRIEGRAGVVELDTVLPITAPLEPGQTYRIIANGRETTTFTLPAPDLRDTFIAESPIESAEVVVAGSAPPSWDGKT